MKAPILWRTAAFVTIAVTLAGPARADERKFAGEIDDYTATQDPAGPWHISGEWAVRLRGDSRPGRGDR